MIAGFLSGCVSRPARLIIPGEGLSVATQTPVPTLEGDEISSLTATPDEISTETATPNPSPTATATPFSRGDGIAIKCVPEENTQLMPVYKVINGNTIAAGVGKRSVRMRLAGVAVREDYEDIAYQYLKDRIEGRFVMVSGDSLGEDDEGNLIRYVISADQATFVNYELLRQGLAVYQSEGGLRCDDLLVSAEELARKEGLGLWNGGDH